MPAPSGDAPPAARFQARKAPASRPRAQRDTRCHSGAGRGTSAEVPRPPLLRHVFFRDVNMHSVRIQCRRRFRQGALAVVAAASFMAGVVGPAAPAQAAEITDGLALWYKLDATSGTVAADASGNGRNGTVNGTASW